MAATGTPTPEEVAILQPLVDEGLLPASDPDRPAVHGPGVVENASLTARTCARPRPFWTRRAGSRATTASAATRATTLTLEFLNDNRSSNGDRTPYVENLIALGVDASFDTIDDPQFEDRTRARPMISTSSPTTADRLLLGLEPRRAEAVLRVCHRQCLGLQRDGAEKPRRSTG
jgi:hypothetical protein